MARRKMSNNQENAFTMTPEELLKTIQSWYDKAVSGDAPAHIVAPNLKYEKENDLAVYVQCVERMGQLAEIMKIYPKTMTLEQVKETVEYQLEKYRKLVIGQ